jgi:hypothetical protein
MQIFVQINTPSLLCPSLCLLGLNRKANGRLDMSTRRNTAGTFNTSKTFLNVSEETAKGLKVLRSFLGVKTLYFC